MTELETKRAAVADLLARIEGLDPQNRAVLDQRVERAVDGFDPGAPEPNDPARADLHRLLRDYRDLRDLPADRANVRLAEKGEVFAPEDDA
ncbi:hypothetical protein [Methylorubrum aminovorans]|nr:MULTISPECIES: hypothetical protein [unclassified Methylobacterium]QIJ75319.1 hypothetical protein CLZ_12375 [Methylobacterium sp. CLZ]QIJ80224.1 hypothetical protein GU700_12375 [Methylobacterium sp. NI91]